MDTLQPEILPPKYFYSIKKNKVKKYQIHFKGGKIQLSSNTMFTYTSKSIPNDLATN